MNVPIPRAHAAVFDPGGIVDDSGRVHQMLPPEAGLVTRCGLPADDLDVWSVLDAGAADCELCRLTSDDMALRAIVGRAGVGQHGRRSTRTRRTGTPCPSMLIGSRPSS